MESTNTNLNEPPNEETVSVVIIPNLQQECCCCFYRHSIIPINNSKSILFCNQHIIGGSDYSIFGITLLGLFGLSTPYYLILFYFGHYVFQQSIGFKIIIIISFLEMLSTFYFFIKM